MNVLNEQMITDTEAKEILEKREKEVELKYEQKNALEILRRFVKFDSNKIKTLVEELKRIPKLRERQIIAIANFLPEDKDDLRVILHKEYNDLSQEELELILQTVRKCV